LYCLGGSIKKRKKWSTGGTEEHWEIKKARRVYLYCTSSASRPKHPKFKHIESKCKNGANTKEHLDTIKTTTGRTIEI